MQSLKLVTLAVLAVLVSACGTTTQLPTPRSHRVPVSGGTASATAAPMPLNRPDVVKALGCELAPWGREPVFAGKTLGEVLDAVGREYFLPLYPSASSFSIASWDGEPLLEEEANPSEWYLVFARPGDRGMGAVHVWQSSADTYMATPGPDCVRP